jgi:hypothetical protein
MLLRDMVTFIGNDHLCRVMLRLLVLVLLKIIWHTIIVIEHLSLWLRRSHAILRMTQVRVEGWVNIYASVN